MLLAALAVFFSYFGTEVVTIAAGEASDPAEAVRPRHEQRGVAHPGASTWARSSSSSHCCRGTTPHALHSPYVGVLDRLGLPGAGAIMDVVVLSAVLSCLNSGIYSSSRMLYALSRRGQAPRAFAVTTAGGVPLWSVLAASSAGLATVVANYFLPTEAVFDFLLDSSGAVAVVVYLTITATQLRGRARLNRDNPGALTLKMWGYPYLSILVGGLLLAVMAGMAFDPQSRRSLALTLLVTGAAITAGLVRQRMTPTTTAT